MSVLDDYPKVNRDEVKKLREVLARVPNLEGQALRDFAASINDLADKACDVEDIFQRLLRGPASADELADLLIALQLTLEQIRGESGWMGERLYEYGDSLRPEGRETHSD